MSLKGHLRAPEKRPVGTGVSDGLAWTMFRPFQWAGRDFQIFFGSEADNLMRLLSRAPAEGKRRQFLCVSVPQTLFEGFIAEALALSPQAVLLLTT